jgi:hypothetical protein
MGEDQELIDRIEALAHEEHELFEKESHGEATRRERERVAEIEAELDSAYDLLRRRRARRAAGLDPAIEPAVDLTTAEEPAG